jgi:hypothetical protein
MESTLGKNDEDESKKTKWTRKPGGTLEFYGNYLHANWSLFDVRVLFGQLKPELGDSSEFIVEEQAAFILSWAQAKNLGQILTGMIEAYESVNGPIAKPLLAPKYEDIKRSEG